MTDHSEATAALLNSLLGDRFAVATATPAVVDHALFPEELGYIAHAVAKRRAEFGTVRVCARRALEELGIPSCALVPSSHGVPQWPAGIVGSMSHTDDVCAVGVTSASSVLAVGIDVEQDTALDSDLEDLICNASERTWIRQQDPALRHRLGKLFFSAKEAAFKCHFARTKALVDFLDLHLAIDMRKQVFRVAGIEASVELGSGNEEILGRFGYTARHLLTVAVVERSVSR